ncbi:MAG: hypothetical protein LWX11_06265, partial [Firmicutes bacterium]|nr:hypothetical protein [Bacillota bacterium]
MFRLLIALCLLLVVSAPSPLQAQDKVNASKGKSRPAKILPSPMLYGRELLDQWMVATQGVNWMQPRTRAFPGQRLIVALQGRGEGRDQTLKEALLTLKLSFAKKDLSLEGLRPTLVRACKAEGADFVNYVLSATGVSKPEDLQDQLSMVSIALFDLGWSVPADASDGEIGISGTCQAAGKTLQLEQTTLQIESFESAVKSGGFKNQEALGEWIMTYYQHPEPPRLLNAFRIEGDNKNAFAPNTMQFYVEALKASPDTDNALLSRLKDEQRGTRLYGFLMLKEAGFDVSKVITKLSKEDQEAFARVTSQGSVLPDAYDLRVIEGDRVGLPSRLDMLWSIFLATGSAKPVRAIASTLQWREDWKVLQKVKEEYQKTGKGPAQITPELLRALAYGAAGWSLGSFYRNHGLATDY